MRIFKNVYGILFILSAIISFSVFLSESHSNTTAKQNQKIEEKTAEKAI